MDCITTLRENFNFITNLKEKNLKSKEAVKETGEADLKKERL